MELVDLSRYEVTGVMGAGADYEARAAIDRETGKQVVLKRPEPQMVRRQLHAGIEARTDRILHMRQEVGDAIPMVVPFLGYTERRNHDAYFGDSMGQEYRVVVEERAAGIPLVGDTKARFTGVPIGAGQNLFALFPLVHPETSPPFAVLSQLLDVEAAFLQAGYLLLDLRPHNVFYQPDSGRITVIDCGALTALHEAPASSGKPPPDVHDFYLEMLKFYTTPQPPPAQVLAYREPSGLRPVVNFEQELDQMARQFQTVADSAVQETALGLIDQVRQRAYTAFDDFRRDLTAYLEAVASAHQALPNLAEAQQVWAEALDWLREDYWQRYLFDADTALALLRR
ncbi:MAG: ribosomal biogenesis LAS1 family protein [Candidatus Tectomicrobia bacterium]|nr:ribosomal biogenesis LAS1 family protein [Candidatus Tectomicrobia bacterium]